MSSSETNLSIERKPLEELCKELQAERDQLKTKVHELQEERDQLKKAVLKLTWEDVDISEEELLACIGRQPPLEEFIAQLAAS